VAAAEPLYVLGTRPGANAVVVGPRESLGRTSVTARGRLYADVDRAEAKLRYRSPAVGATVEPTTRGFRLELDEPAYGVAKGQAAVLYDGEAVVGYGLITDAH
jgi:tRNA-specific 2-thiouridylase